MATSHTDIDQGTKHNGATVIEYRRARMWGRIDIGLTMISLSGEIDASNVDDLSRHARRLVPDHGALIVDLTDTEFIGVEGLHVLFALDIDCARADTTWAVIVSHAANRLLRVAGEHGKLLPAVRSATEALRVIRETGANNRTVGTTRFRASSDSPVPPAGSAQRRPDRLITVGRAPGFLRGARDGRPIVGRRP